MACLALLSTIGSAGWSPAGLPTAQYPMQPDTATRFPVCAPNAMRHQPVCAVLGYKNNRDEDAFLKALDADIEHETTAIDQCADEEECLVEEADKVHNQFRMFSLHAAGKGGLAMRARLQATKREGELRDLASKVPTRLAAPNACTAARLSTFIT